MDQNIKNDSFQGPSAKHCIALLPSDLEFCELLFSLTIILEYRVKCTAIIGLACATRVNDQLTKCKIGLTAFH